MIYAVLAISLVTAFVIAEFAARYYLRHIARPYVFRPGSKLHMHIDRESLPTLDPLARSEANSDGERSDEDVPRDHRKSFRVLLAGGSAAECFYLDQDVAWHGALKRELSSPKNLAILGTQHVHVGNVARAGVNTAACLEMMEFLIPHYKKIDVLLFMVGAGDLVRWMAQGALDEDEEGPYAMRDFMAFIPDRPYSWQPMQTALSFVARRMLWPFRNGIEIKERTGKTLIELRKMRAAAKTMRDETGDPKVMLERFEHYMRRIVETCRSKAKRIILVQQPCFRKNHSPEEKSRFWNAAVGNPFKGPCDVYFSEDIFAERLQELNDRAAKVAADMGLETIDLMPILDHSLETFYDLIHFTPRGSGVVAQYVAETILRTPKKT